MQVFDAFYYANGCGPAYERNPQWLAAFDAIAARIAADPGPGTVLDAGCAIGLLVETLRNHGIKAFGIDISEYAIMHAYEPIRPFCSIASLSDELARNYDLIVSVEVLEHMSKEDGEKAIANFCRHTDDVIFSSTPFDYKEVTHVNVQPPEYWAEMFATQGFYRDVDYDASYITAWAVRFRRGQNPVARIVRNYERRYWLLAKENFDLRQLSMELRQRLAASLEAAKADAVEARQAAVEEATAAAGSAPTASLESTNSATIDALQRMTVTTLAALANLENEPEWGVEAQNTGIGEREESTQPLPEPLANRIIEIAQLIASLRAQVADGERQRAALQDNLAEIAQLIASLRAQVADGERQRAALQDNLAEKERAIVSLRGSLQDFHNHWVALQHSPGWSILVRLQRLRAWVSPPGSRRDRMVSAFFYRLQRGQAGTHAGGGKEAAGDLRSQGQVDATVSLSASMTMTAAVAGADRLRLALYTTDNWNSACALIRVLGPARHLSDSLEILPGTRWDCQPQIVFPDDADAIIIQRDFPRHEALYRQVTNWARRAGKPVIYELDDLLLELADEHPEKPYYRAVRPLLLRALVDADAAIVSSLNLSDYVRAFNRNTWLLPNYLDDHLWHLHRPGELRSLGKSTHSQPARIGYMGGATATHLADLDLIVPVLQQLLRDYGDRVQLRFWGCLPKELADNPGVILMKPSIPDYATFASYFSSQECDIFLAPLKDNWFNRCKSSIKFLEYSSLGVAGIYSRIAPYEAVVKDGENGLLAGSAGEWQAHLHRLIDDADLRTRLGQAALQTTSQLLLSKHAREWGTVYRSALSAARSGTDRSASLLAAQVRIRQWEQESGSQ